MNSKLKLQVKTYNSKKIVNILFENSKTFELFLTDNVSYSRLAAVAELHAALPQYICNLKAKTIPKLNRVPQSKFEANWSRGSWRETNKQRLPLFLFIYLT